MSEQKRIRWYNPVLEDFEWREIPKSDEEALSQLDRCLGSEEYAEVYGEWRSLGPTSRWLSFGRATQRGRRGESEPSAVPLFFLFAVRFHRIGHGLPAIVLPSSLFDSLLGGSAGAESRHEFVIPPPQNEHVGVPFQVGPRWESQL